MGGISLVAGLLERGSTVVPFLFFLTYLGFGKTLLSLDMISFLAPFVSSLNSSFQFLFLLNFIHYPFHK